ncbi:hypothetical protein [Kangiella sp. TOML190]|uniref:hypothetical protein n=1 Tax=Kangiella sp. TOML190 TaxID=2931351 RepID=UPI0020424BE0|nr:hypothetical protein [Kangiella sp. TOML190]
MKKILLALFLLVTLLPLFNFFYATSVATEIFNDHSNFDHYENLIFLQMGFVFTLVIVYLFLNYKLDNIAKNKKGLWSLAILFFNIFSMPVFWYLFLWKEDSSNNVN